MDKSISKIPELFFFAFVGRGDSMNGRGETHLPTQFFSRFVPV